MQVRRFASFKWLRVVTSTRAEPRLLYVKRGTTPTLRKAWGTFHCKRMASALGKQKLPFLQTESKNQKSGFSIFLGLTHSACKCQNFGLNSFPEL